MDLIHLMYILLLFQQGHGSEVTLKYVESKTQKPSSNTKKLQATVPTRAELLSKSKSYSTQDPSKKTT